MRDVLIALLVLAVGVWWFSANGPRPPEGRRNTAWVMDGDGPGAESVTAGYGAEVTEVFRPEQTVPADTGAPDTHSVTAGTKPETAEEVGDVEPFLIGYAAGVAAVMLGMFAGWTVVWLYHKITK